jgi:hypothetical protein
LHAAQRTAQNPRLAAIAVEAKAIDDRHDDLVRGTDLVLEGLALLAGAGAKPDALTSLRAVLAFPMSRPGPRSPMVLPLAEPWQAFAARAHTLGRASARRGRPSAPRRATFMCRCGSSSPRGASP